MIAKFAALAALLGTSSAQQVGKEKTEVHPKLSWQKCSSGGSCTTVNGEITIDSNWRWVHDTKGYSNCYSGNSWNTTICKDPKSCASNCAVDGADYSGTYGASTSGNALTINFITKGEYCKLSMVFVEVLCCSHRDSHQHRVSFLSDERRHQVPNVYPSWQRVHL
jgi:cellulose 1,4-beta-cellobiosidase